MIPDLHYNDLLLKSDTVAETMCKQIDVKAFHAVEFTSFNS